MKDSLKNADAWIERHRPWTLLATIVATLAAIAAIDWLTNAQLFERFFYPTACNPQTPTKCDPIEWKELFQAGILLLGLPVAFWLWHWRDRNVRDQIENARKDLNLREFNDVQIRLAGAIDDGISEKSRVALQTNALFQMSAFLSGDRGHSFSRAAFEAIRAKFASDFEELFRAKFKREIQDVEEIYEKMIHGRFPKYGRLFMLTAHFRHDLREIRNLYQKDPSKRMNRRFFQENCEDIFLNNENARHFDISTLNIPLSFSGKNLTGIQAIGSILSGDRIDNSNLSGSNLLGATFREVEITNCDFQYSIVDLSQFVNSTLTKCDFSYTKLRRIHLIDLDPLTHEWRNSKFLKCKFTGADLTWARLGEQDLTDSDFSSATLICADFDRCDVAGSDFSNCDMRGAIMTRIDPQDLKSCKGARFDDATRFHLPAPGTGLSWTHEQLQEMRDLWRSCGARHIDDP